MKHFNDRTINYYATVFCCTIYFALMFGGGSPLSAQVINGCFNFVNAELRPPKTRLISPTFNSDDYYGDGVALAGNTLAVGDPGDDELGSNAGAIFIYQKAANVWNLMTKLFSNNIVANDQFGKQVAMSGNLLASVHQNSLNGATSVYAFHQDGNQWIQDIEIASNAHTNIALSGTHLLIATPHSDLIRIYQKVNSGIWRYVGYFQEPALESDLRYGESVAIDGNYLVIGAPRQNSAAVAPSMIQIWKMVNPNPNIGDQWVKVATFTNSGDQYGSSVAISGNTVVVGAPNTGTPGAVYTYVTDGAVWTPSAVLAVSSCDTHTVYGAIVAIKNDTIAILGKTYGIYPAPVLIYKRMSGQWYPAYSIPPVDHSPGVDESVFHESVSMDVDRIALGESIASFGPGNANLGAVYLYGSVDLNDLVRIETVHSPKDYTQLVSDPPGINCGPTCSKLIPRGTTIDIKAFSTDPNLYVTGWSLPYCGQVNSLGVNHCEVTLNDNMRFEVFYGGARPTCGNSICDVGESCSNCPADCGVCSPRCGNGIMEPPEQCDGTDLGGQTCSSPGIGYNRGTLSCNSGCRLDVSQCSNCGDGICAPYNGETCSNCPVDCGPCAFVCQGPIPMHATLCPGDDQGLTAANIEYWLVNSCTPTRKCEMTCTPPYIISGSMCTLCGNGICEASAGETYANCPADCQSQPTYIWTSSPWSVCNGACGEIGTQTRTVSCHQDDASGPMVADSYCPSPKPVTTQACNPQACICGDGLVTPPELCDGVNFNGQTCASLGFAGGPLTCTLSCAFNTSACIPFVPWHLVSPPSRSTLTSSPVNFQIESVGALNYVIRIGKTFNGNSGTEYYFGTGTGTAGSNTVNIPVAIPIDGNMVYVTLYSWKDNINNSTRQDFTFATRDTTPPTAPTGLTAVNVSTNSTPSFLIRWKASTDNSGAISRYDIYRNGTLIASTLASQLSYQAGSPKGLASFSFYVKAVDAAGNVSLPSNTVTVKALSGTS